MIDFKSMSEELKGSVNESVKEIAKEMHHTVAICSKSYLIKELIDREFHSKDPSLAFKHKSLLS